MNFIAKIFIRLSLGILVICNSVAHAQTSSEYAKTQAMNASLSDSDDWQHLIQYTPRLFGGLSSEIQSQQSFFAVDGSTNPQSELLATIDAMFIPVGADMSADDHPRCKYIARYEFLKRHITFPNEIKAIECVKFKQWVNIQNIDSISLVFASGYFKNPASFYGHPLLKFNTAKNSTSGLLDITINNGAIVPDNENPILYMIKGVFGGYDAAFSDTKFYQLNHSYSESDLRDLWDYELDLTNDQKERIIYYSWELLSQRFTYKFFSQNCGYFLEDLLQYALGKRLSPRNRIYSVPANTFFNIMEVSNNGNPLVKRVTRIPSRQSKFTENYLSLSDSARSAVDRYLDTGSFDSRFSESDRLQIIDTLTDYYSFLISKTDNDNKKKRLTIERTKLYAERLKLGDSTKKTSLTTSSVTPPHTGSRPSVVRLGYVYNSELGSGVRFRIRPVSYDLLDLDDGHVPNSTLNMFNTEITVIDGQERVNRFDLVEIKTFNISRTGLPGDGGLGWGLRVGLERGDNACIDCLLAHVSASGIKAKQINSSLTLYAEGEVSYHSSFEDGSFRTATTIGAIAKPLKGWKTNLLVGARAPIDGNGDTDTIVRWENRFGDNSNRNIRFDINYDGTTEIQLNYGIYW